MALLDAAKLAMRITVDTYDDEIAGLIQSAKLDLGLAGVDYVSESDQLIRTAIITYCRLHFGSPADYERLKASYDEQKAQLRMATGYTNFDYLGGEEAGHADCW